MTDFVTKNDCQYNAKKCYKINIEPLRMDLKEIKTELKNETTESRKFREDMRVVIAKLPEIMEDKFDDRYANKQTENSVDRIRDDMRKIVYIILTAVILAVLGTILK